MSICLSSLSFFPAHQSITLSCVFLCSCAHSVCVFFFIVLMALGVCVSVSACARSMSIPHLSPPLPLYVCACVCVWCESRSVGICWPTPTIPSIPPSPPPPCLPPTHTQPEGLCVLCPSSHLYVPDMPSSAQFSSAQLGSMD